MEDELEALELEVRGVAEPEVVTYPAAPDNEPKQAKTSQKARAEARARETNSANVAEPILV